MNLSVDSATVQLQSVIALHSVQMLLLLQLQQYSVRLHAGESVLILLVL